MFKLFLFLTCLNIINAVVIIQLTSGVQIYDCELQPQKHLNLEGWTKIMKDNVEHLLIINCSGIIDDKTFMELPKLARLSIWKSSISEIRTTLPINELEVAMFSEFPNLDQDLQQKLPKLQYLRLEDIVDLQVDHNILKKFKELTNLNIFKANFTKDCITKEWFKEMRSLRQLVLGGSNLNCISEDAFDSLENLDTLDLRDNHIFEFKSTTFKNLRNLRILRIYGNDIENIDLNNFASQKNSLMYLGISWNTLIQSNISAEELLKAFPKLKLVGLGEKNLPYNGEGELFCQKLRVNGASCF